MTTHTASDNFNRVSQALTATGFVSGIRQLDSGHLAFTTILTYPDGGSIEVYVQAEELSANRGSYRLTDFGNTASWLANLGIEIWSDLLYRELVDLTLRGTWVNREADTLLTRPLALEELSAGAIELAQMCLRIADLAYVRKASSSNRGATTAKPLPRKTTSGNAGRPVKSG